MFEKLKTIFLYAGVDQLSFERVKPRILRANRVLTIVLSSIATLLIGMMYLSSFRAKSIMQNRIIYELGLVLSIIILVLSISLTKTKPWLITILVQASYFIYYMYGILIGTITDPEGKTVTFMVMLVFMPVLFITRPLHNLCVTIIYDLVFVILCLHNKAGDVLSIDCMDAVVFGILGIVSGTTITHMKVRGYASEDKLTKISRIDQLTQMNNQSAFIIDTPTIGELCKYSLACLYIDVNGLHELNNEKGHEYGDLMLQFIGEKMKEYFSFDLSYRIGGDEFVAFILDAKPEEVEQKLSMLIHDIEHENYHVAVGYEVVNLRHLNVDNLIQSAELKMRRNKDRYYQKATRTSRKE